MDVPELHPIREKALHAVITTINQAKEKLGNRQSLGSLARSGDFAWGNLKISLKPIKAPVAISAQKLIANTIEKEWKLKRVFLYHLIYKGCFKDDICIYYYYEAIFSQPTAEYPIPQATVSVYFKVQVKLTSVVDTAPLVSFRIEGHHEEHDVRYVILIPDWILAVIQMKIKFFKRVEELKLF